MQYIERLTSVGYDIIQDDEHFKLGTDSVLIASFCRLKTNIKVCDLGCGTGVITLLITGLEKTAKVDGFEILPTACALAKKSVELNSLNERVRIINGDINNIKENLNAGSYDLVVSNPPYFKADGGAAPRSERIDSARSERSLDVDSLCRAVAYILRWGGNFCVIYRVERMVDLFCAMRQNGMEPKRLRYISHSALKTPHLFMIEARRGAKPGLTLLPTLYMTNSDGTESEEVRRIYKLHELK